MASLLLDSLCIKQAPHTRRYLAIQIKVIRNLAVGASSSHLSFYLVSLYLFGTVPWHSSDGLDVLEYAGRSESSQYKPCDDWPDTFRLSVQM